MVTGVYVEHGTAEEAASLLGDQEQSMRKGHHQIQEDISKVKENIQQVWERVGKQ